MMNVTLLSLILLAAPVTASGQTGGEGCPVPTPRAEERVKSFLSIPWLAAAGDRLNLGTASAADVVPLAGAADQEACRALLEAVRAQSGERGLAGQVWLYRSGDRFFVPTTPTTPARPAPPAGAVRIGEHSFIEIYDTDYRFVARVDG